MGENPLNVIEAVAAKMLATALVGFGGFVFTDSVLIGLVTATLVGSFLFLKT